jgi:hypothetical protein
MTVLISIEIKSRDKKEKQPKYFSSGEAWWVIDTNGRMFEEVFV